MDETKLSELKLTVDKICKSYNDTISYELLESSASVELHGGVPHFSLEEDIIINLLFPSGVSIEESQLRELSQKLSSLENVTRVTLQFV
ncbi:hypothetical protein HYV49_04195 [Candidatus Pacearchaeota archaeon]|nr:hypothetical protein [Candidatus Pacearchaeota archaeon]